ncbi:hypothetical protein T10_10375 [Trichinella papuae]|uniref:Uncharacterized protein n=1 Tax=Trichinella papuae TaxID=268474 RepID=A0A0V1MS73_9BILA|nr:hypothetical protein T10_10375 [Trichinella papuae]
MHVGRLFTNANCTRKFQESSQATIGMSSFSRKYEEAKEIHYPHGGVEMSNFCYAHLINPPPNRSTAPTNNVRKNWALPKVEAEPICKLD